jgi:hypothetical protein
MAKKIIATGPTVDANTDVVLFDGATLNVAVRVFFKTTAQPEAIVRIAVSDWFHGDGYSQQLTVSKFVNDSNYSSNLIEKLKRLNDASNASLVSYSLKSAPIAGFEEKSKQLTAVLKSGETVRLIFGAPPGMPAAPSSFEINKAYELLTKLNLSELGVGFQKKLNDNLLPANNGWGYLILSLEVVNCPCKAG